MLLLHVVAKDTMGVPEYLTCMLRSILPPKMEERITHRATMHACKHTAHVAAYRSTHTKDYM